MRVITDTYNIYNFEELTETAKQKAIENWMMNSQEIYNDLFYEYVTNEISILFPDSQLGCSYDLSYCQGDYFSFEGDINFIDVWNNINKDNYTEKEKEFLSNYLPRNYYKINSWHNKYEFVNGFYQYDYIGDMLYYDCENYYYEDIENYTQEEIQECKALEKFEKDFYEYMSNLTCEYKEIGYNWLYPNNDTIIEDIINSDIEFYEDGKIY